MNVSSCWTLQFNIHKNQLRFANLNLKLKNKIFQKGDPIIRIISHNLRRSKQGCHWVFEIFSRVFEFFGNMVHFSRLKLHFLVFFPRVSPIFVAVIVVVIITLILILAVLTLTQINQERQISDLINPLCFNQSQWRNYCC